MVGAFEEIVLVTLETAATGGFSSENWKEPVAEIAKKLASGGISGAASRYRGQAEVGLQFLSNVIDAATTRTIDAWADNVVVQNAMMAGGAAAISAGLRSSIQIAASEGIELYLRKHHPGLSNKAITDWKTTFKTLSGKAYDRLLAPVFEDFANEVAPPI